MLEAIFDENKLILHRSGCKPKILYSEFKSIIKNNGGFIRCGWDGTEKTELQIKNETKATIRCILDNVNVNNKKCIYSGSPAKHEVIFAKAY